MAKTTETLNHPVRVYFDDGECYHERAAIVFTHGAPAYVRAEHPNAIYPWERVRSIIRVADLPEQNTVAPKAEQSSADRYLDNERKALIIDNERLRDQVDHLKEEIGRHSNARISFAKEAADRFNRLAAASGLLGDDGSSWDDLVKHVVTLHVQADTSSNLLRSIAEHVGDALGRSVNPRDPGTALDIAADIRNLRADLASVTEQRDELRRQLEDLRAELRRPNVNGARSLAEIERDALQRQVEYLRDELNKSSKTSVQETEPTDSDAAQANTRDSIRTTCLSAGAKDCSVFFGPGKDDITIVVEMRSKYSLDKIRSELAIKHGLAASQYKLREVKS